MIWISHRGESIDAPENTLAAFKLSLERQTEGMECDVHLTKDGKLVVCHDSSTKRTCGGEGIIIEDSTFEELQALCASNNKSGYENEKIPLFSDTLQYLGKDRKYYIEIKKNDPAVIDAVVHELDAAGIPPEKTVIISFHSDIVRIYKERYPEREALFLTMFYVNKNGTWWPCAEDLIKDLKAQGADGVDIHCNQVFVNKEYVDTVKAASFKFAVWTIDSVELAKRFIDMGVDVITSNCAAKLKHEIDNQ